MSQRESLEKSVNLGSTHVGEAMLRQIMIQAEAHDEHPSMFRLSIDALVIAKGVTVGQACFLVSEILGRIGRLETVRPGRSTPTAVQECASKSNRPV